MIQTFILLATTRREGRNQYGSLKYELSTRIEVRARTLHDAYKAARAMPEFKSAHFGPEKP